VAEQYSSDGTWLSIPASPPSSAKYVSSVEVQDGTVLLTYGARAHAQIAGKAIAIAPGVDGTGAVVWACGEGAHGPDVKPGPGPAGSEVLAKHLPKACRAN
jgi:hypothetical protein